MIKFLAKVAVNGIGVYVVAKVLEETKVLEKGLATVVQIADRALTDFAKAKMQQQNGGTV